MMRIRCASLILIHTAIFTKYRGRTSVKIIKIRCIVYLGEEGYHVRMKNKKAWIAGGIIVLVLFTIYFISIGRTNMQKWCIDKLIQQVNYSGNRDGTNDMKVQEQCMPYRVLRDGGTIRHYPLNIQISGSSKGWVMDYILPPNCPSGTKCSSLPINE